MENRRIRSTPLETLNSKGFITFYIILIVLLPIIFLFLEECSASHEEPYSAFALAYMTAVFLSFLLIYYVDKYHRYKELYEATITSAKDLETMLLSLSLIQHKIDTDGNGEIIKKHQKLLEDEYKDIVKRILKHIMDEDEYHHGFKLEKWKYMKHNYHNFSKEIFCEAIIVANSFNLSVTEFEALYQYLKDFAHYDIFYNSNLFVKCINNKFPDEHIRHNNKYKNIKIPEDCFEYESK